MERMYQCLFLVYRSYNDLQLSFDLNLDTYVQLKLSHQPPGMFDLQREECNDKCIFESMMVSAHLNDFVYSVC